jgi:hypothetical protein
MSPEQCRSEPIDGRADIYGLGGTYYALLTGRPPYFLGDEDQIMQAQCLQPIPNPRAVNPNVPELCAAIVRQALAKNRTDRFASAAEFGDALSALLPPVAAPVEGRSGPVQCSRSGDTSGAGSALARSVTTSATEVAAPTPGPRRRLPRLALLGGILLIVLLLVVGGLAFNRHSGGRQEPIAVDRLPPGPVHLRALPALEGHAATARVAVAFAQTSRRLASGGEDKLARVWDIATGRSLHVYPHRDPIDAVALSPDGAVLAVGDRAQTVHFWEVATGLSLGSVGPFASQVVSLAFSPSGKKLAVGHGAGLQLLDLEPPATVRQRKTLLANRWMVSTVVFSPDGQHLAAVTYEGSVHVWDAAGNSPRVYSDGQQAMLGAVALSADGSKVIFGCRENKGWLKLWEPNLDGKPTLLEEGTGGVQGIVVAPGGQVIYTGAWGGPLRVRQRIDAQPRLVRSGVRGAIVSLSLSGDGRRLACGSDEGSIRLFEVLAGPGPGSPEERLP